MSNVDTTDTPPNDGEVFNPDDRGTEQPQPRTKPQPLYQIYTGSKIAVSSAVGKAWQKRYEAAIKAYQPIHEVWDTVFRYFNHNQSVSLETPRGTFKRGDSTENIIFANIGTVMPAIYSKNPDITCSTTDEADQPFCDAMQATINALFQRVDKLNAKQKIKRATGLGLLTNLGIIKLDFVEKDDSREAAATGLQQITAELAKAKTTEDVEDLYGKLEALEQNMEVMDPSGPGLKTVLPHNLIVDPYAEAADGTDARWMIERAYFPTAGLIARFTKDAKNEDDDPQQNLLYKSTHMAVFASDSVEQRDDGLGLVLKAISSEDQSRFNSHTYDERQAFIDLYYTECLVVWDKPTRRVMLFHKDDWTWPIWVWDDPYQLTRFFPYFIMSFSLSTGGTVNVGENAYFLDQQDEINDINRQLAKIRRSVFDFFYYNSDLVDKDQAENFIKAIRGESSGGPNVLGVKAGEQKISELIQAFIPPQIQVKELFNKDAILATVYRMTNISDAQRGVQMKTNTNEAAVNMYQESMQNSTGSKVDVVEDVVADLATALSELIVQKMTKEDVAGLIGDALAAGYEQISVPLLKAKYSVQLVAGSMEKPNSAFKKKEAIQVAQAVGQFAQAAPAATLQIMLRVLSGAFTEVNIKPEDWHAIANEAAATAQKGISTGGGGGGTGAPSGPAQPQPGGPSGPQAPAPGAGASGGGAPATGGGPAQPGQPPAQPPASIPPAIQALLEQAKQLPPADQQQIMQMWQQHKNPQEIVAFIQQRIGHGTPANEPASG